MLARFSWSNLAGCAFLLSLAWAMVGQAQTVTCPTSPNRVNVTVNVAVSFDSATNLFTYSYTVASASTSEQDVHNFALDFAGPVSNVTRPVGWTNSAFSFRPTLHWFASDAAPLAPGVPDRGQIPPALSQIKPGNSLSGFAFESPNPPGPVNFYVLGFVDVSVASSEAEAETFVASCPETFGGFFDVAVRGQTQGPITFRPVEIDIKPHSGPNNLNPQGGGPIGVAVLSNPSFDARSLDPATVRFGPAEAPEIPERRQTQDINHDGLLDVVFRFTISATGIPCGATSATLTGQTTGGISIQGSDSVNTVGCRM